MSPARALVLTVGPLLLIGASLALSTPRAAAGLRRWLDHARHDLLSEDADRDPEDLATEPAWGLLQPVQSRRLHYPSPRSHRTSKQTTSEDDDSGDDVRHDDRQEDGTTPKRAGGKSDRIRRESRSSASRSHDAAASPRDLLTAECEKAAARLRRRLDDDCHIIVRTPFVLGGDGSEDHLAEAHDRLLAPIARTLSHCYFDKPPDAPVTVLLFSTDAAFHDAARKLDRRRHDDYYGYYLREERRLMLNASTGAGTVAHELTHALAHFDFPTMPEWLDEGLASLHEEAEFAEDGRSIVGRSNWRVNHLLLGMRRKQVRTIEELITSDEAVRPNLDAVDYAHARFLCLYLQELGLLEPYYQALRRAGTADPTGIETLKAKIAPQSLDAFDQEFRRWIHRFRPISRRILFGTQRL